MRFYPATGVGLAPERSRYWPLHSRLDAGRPLAVAAVTALRGNGGTFPSQAQKSDPQGVQERAEGAPARRVILHARPLPRAVCVNVPGPLSEP